MKHLTRVCIFFGLISLPGFASDHGSANVDFSKPIMVGSTELPAGTYFVRWTTPGPDVQVRFLKGSKVIMLVSARLTPADNVAAVRGVPNGVEVMTQQDGSATRLKELELAHSNLSFSEEALTPR